MSKESRPQPEQHTRQSTNDADPSIIIGDVTRGFRELRDLSNEIRNLPETSPDRLLKTAKFHHLANSLLDLMPSNGLCPAKSLGIAAVTDALAVWEADVSTHESSAPDAQSTLEKLAVRALNSFYGEAQPTLKDAFLEAKESGEPINELLDKPESNPETQ